MKQRTVKDIIFLSMWAAIAAAGIWVTSTLFPKLPQIGAVVVGLPLYNSVLKYFKPRLDLMTSSFKWEWYGWSIFSVLSGCFVTVGLEFETIGMLMVFGPLLYALFILLRAPDSVNDTPSGWKAG